MGLPIFQLESEPYRFSNGEETTIRSLSRAEAIQVRLVIPDVERLEVLAISFATGTPQDEVEAWIKATPSPEVDKLVKAITRLSGLDEDEGKADAEA
jgi:hypothetical protein